MDTETAAKAFKEMGHPARLDIFRYLVKAGDQGAPVGELQQALQIPHSTLSHHISALVQANLVQQRREGRTLYCVPQFDMLNGLVDFMVRECCMGTTGSVNNG